MSPVNSVKVLQVYSERILVGDSGIISTTESDLLAQRSSLCSKLPAVARDLIKDILAKGLTRFS